MWFIFFQSWLLHREVISAFPISAINISSTIKRRFYSIFRREFKRAEHLTVTQTIRKKSLHFLRWHPGSLLLIWPMISLRSAWTELKLKNNQAAFALGKLREVHCGGITEQFNTGVKWTTLLFLIHFDDPPGHCLTLKHYAGQWNHVWTHTVHRVPQSATIKLVPWNTQCCSGGAF